MTSIEPVIGPELALVAGGLSKPALAVEAAGYVDSNDFQDKRLGLIWKSLLSIIDDGTNPDQIDSIAIAAKCAKTQALQRKIAEYCDEIIASAPKNLALTTLAQRIHARATMRLAMDQLVSIGKELRSKLEWAEGEMPDLDSRLASLSVSVASRADSTLKRAVFGDVAKEVAAYFDEISYPAHGKTIPTGLKKLDWRLGGGLRMGQLHSVLGTTGSGKTGLASQFCDSAVANGHRALMFSMEVDPLDVFIRDTERNAGRSRWDLRSPLIAVREAAQKDLLNAQAALITGDGKGKVIYGEPMSVESIRQIVLTERLRGGPVSLVAVDHAQVALPNAAEKKGMPRYLEVKSTAEGLRALAKHLNVAVVLTSQMNPPPKGEKPTMALVREGKDINNCSEVVLLIWHEVDEGPDGERFITKSSIIADKVRAGQSGRVTVRFRGDIFRFENLTKEEEDE